MALLSDDESWGELWPGPKSAKPREGTWEAPIVVEDHEEDGFGAKGLTLEDLTMPGGGPSPRSLAAGSRDLLLSSRPGEVEVRRGVAPMVKRMPILPKKMPKKIPKPSMSLAASMALAERDAEDRTKAEEEKVRLAKEKSRVDDRRFKAMAPLGSSAWEKLRDNWMTTFRPSFREGMEGSGFLSPSMLDTLSDLTDVELGDFLKDTARDDPEEPADDEIDSLRALIDSAVGEAKKSRKRKINHVSDLSNLEVPKSEIALAREEAQAMVGRFPSLPAESPLLITSGATSKAKPKSQWPVESRGHKGEVPAKDMENERTKEVDHMVRMLKDYNLPIVRQVAGSRDPSGILSKMAGGKRVGTIRGRIRQMRKLSKWLVTVYGVKFPTEIFHVIEYVQERASEPCGPSVPNSIVGAINFFERAGGIKPEEMLSKSPALINAVHDLFTQLQGSNLTDRKKAPQVPSMFLVCMELVVMDPHKTWYQRAFAFYRLLRCWGTLRYGDTRFMAPSEMKKDEDGLSFILTQTKTTGPGKKVTVLKGYVHNTCYICCPGWMDAGLSLWKLARPERSYFLCLPRKAMDGPRDREASYTACCQASRQLLRELCVPILLPGRQKMELSSVPLLLDEIQLFWQEHSDRATLPSLAAAIGFSKEMRNKLGRWSPDGSDEYVRIQRSCVFEIQKAVAICLRSCYAKGVEVPGERDLFTNLKDYMAKKGFSDHQIATQISALAGELADGPKFPPEEAEAISKELRKQAIDTVSADAFTPTVVADDENDERLSQASEISSPSETVAPAILPREGHEDDRWYVVSIGKSTRCIHQYGLCWRVPGINFKDFEFFRDYTEEGCRWTKICHDCWPGGSGGPVVPKAIEDSDSSDGSSDSSSSGSSS